MFSDTKVVRRVKNTCEAPRTSRSPLFDLVAFFCKRWPVSRDLPSASHVAMINIRKVALATAARSPLNTPIDKGMYTTASNLPKSVKGYTSP